MASNICPPQKKTKSCACVSRPTSKNSNMWNNNGTWWCHFTVHEADYTKERIRLTLATSDQAKARLRRDHLLKSCEKIAGNMRDFWTIRSDSVGNS